ncbi:hypothetical protein FACS1894202_06950 [Clostridia bacterium]|nr:hypothetical protein FACS1894202_06950 [Clostridia bacterium]
MAHNYTRQRQGRDFSILNALAAAEMSIEGNYNNIDGIIGNNDMRDGTDKKKTMLEQLEYFQTVAERNAEPVDGNEPPKERGISL